tara:strand:- start:2538 stop:3467 length:930 start_codon:yes stop_codon:yes gene_type:complete
MPNEAPIKVVKYPWHIGHDYELFKVPFEWSLITDTSRMWASQHRPLPDHVRLIPSHEANESEVMLLHVDQWTLDEIDKRNLFEYWRSHFEGPKIVINHGCNMVDGCSSQEMQDFLGDLPVVANSTTSHRLWGLANSRPILHGFSPEEWPQTDYSDPRVVVVQSHQAGRHSQFRNHEAVTKIEDAGIHLCWVGRDVKFSSWDGYRDFLSHSSILLNPAHASPNPRTRAEAMLCGLAVVSTASQGESDYIENGVNGYCSDDIDELIDHLRLLQNDPDLTRRIGGAGRETAQKVFHIDRFRDEWTELVKSVL